MNKIFKIAMMAIAITTSQMAVAAPPKIMILPDKVWCNANNYVIKEELNGRTRITENFDEAFLDANLRNAIATINGLMQDRQFPLVDFGAQASGDDDEEMLEELFEGAETGSGLNENSFEAALNNGKPDILMRIGWDEHKVGFNYSISYRLEAFDSYSNKAIASVTGQSPVVARTMPLTACLKQSVIDKMDEFVAKLQQHFDDIQANGREIRVNLRMIGSAGDLSFSNEYDGKELSVIIYDWMHANTVNHQFSERTSSRNRLAYDQVRVPMKDANGRPVNARMFIDQLKRFLSATPYNIPCENTSSGLGNGRLYIGEK